MRTGRFNEMLPGIVSCCESFGLPVAAHRRHVHSSSAETGSAVSSRTSYALLALILLLGLALRLHLLSASEGYVDGDEAMVGLQALEILQGRHSVFLLVSYWPAASKPIS